jgi:hypothetical protein
VAIAADPTTDPAGGTLTSEAQPLEQQVVAAKGVPLVPLAAVPRGEHPLPRQIVAFLDLREPDPFPTTVRSRLSKSKSCETFVARYNQDRPHQALGMQVPADVRALAARVSRAPGADGLSCPAPADAS